MTKTAAAEAAGIPDSALKIVQRPIDRIQPYEANARTHSPEQVQKIAASIREFGWTNPCLIRADGTLIAGHGRVEAAKSLGMTKVPVIVLDHLTDAQARALVIADNRLALDAGWDDELLASEIAALNTDGFDIGILGFSEDELKVLKDGWQHSLTDVDRHGENLSGITAVIRVQVEQDAVDHATEVIVSALDKAGVTYSMKD